jgi:hypothetical protein
MRVVRYLEEYWFFLCCRKMHWLGPLLVTLALLALMAFVTERPGMAPKIYAR